MFMFMFMFMFIFMFMLMPMLMLVYQAETVEKVQAHAAREARATASDKMLALLEVLSTSTRLLDHASCVGTAKAMVFDVLHKRVAQHEATFERAAVSYAQMLPMCYCCAMLCYRCGAIVQGYAMMSCCATMRLCYVLLSFCCAVLCHMLYSVVMLGHHYPSVILGCRHTLMLSR